MLICTESNQRSTTRRQALGFVTYRSIGVEQVDLQGYGIARRLSGNGRYCWELPDWMVSLVNLGVSTAALHLF